MEFKKAGSFRTGTAVDFSSDLDLNVVTKENITRAQRNAFKESLASCLAQDTEGQDWQVEHMGKKCITLEARDGSGYVDIAFMNTAFEILGSTLGYVKSLEWGHLGLEKYIL